MVKRSINQLDDLQIRRLIAKGDPVAKTDGAGLTFTLSKAGTASWTLRYMLSGQSKELTIGNYPDISLAAARKLARQRRVEIDHGQDPAAEKKAEKQKEENTWSVQKLADDYRLKRLIAPQFAEQTIYYRVWDFENAICPRLGKQNVDTVTATDVVGMLAKTKRSWLIQRRILTTTSQLFDHAVGKQIITVNPCANIKLTALLGPRPAVKKRVMLSEDELKTLLSNIEDIGTENALAFRILLATCVRSVELVKAKWEHIDYDQMTWTVPDESVKTRTGFLVPLVPQVIGWFKTLQILSGKSVWVLPTRDGRRNNKAKGDANVGATTLWAAINRAFARGGMEIRRFTPHDTRSTAKGHMRNLGISREISEIALNHTLRGMEGIYDVREEIPERRVALEKWAAFIQACGA